MLVLVAAPARAQSAAERAQAQLLFDSARGLMREGKTAQACDAFAQSQQLEPTIGTQLNLAVCYEKLGKTASAWINFTQLQATARRSGQPERAEFAKKAADALAPKLSKVKIDVDASAEGLAVTLDGEPVLAQTWGLLLPVDPGQHTLEATAPAKKPWTKKISVGDEADEVTVTVPALSDAPAWAEPASDAAETEAAADDVESDGSLQVALGWTGLGVGVAAGGVGVLLRVLALSKDEESGEHCVPGDTSRCTQEGADLRDEAQALELGSIIAWAAGGALAVTGLVLVLTAPSADGSGEEAARVDWQLGGGPGLAATSIRVRW